MPTCPRGRSRTETRCGRSGANDQLHKAVDYAPLIIAYHNGSAVRVGDVAKRLIPWKTFEALVMRTDSLQFW